MGSYISRCFPNEDWSSADDQSSRPTTKVITATADLREYTLPTTVCRVLQEETASSPSWFMCNSDRLYYDDFIPALDIDDELQANQIYFIVPKSALQNRLSAADMAAMAVKASSALKAFQDGKTKERRRRNKKARISPDVSVKQQRVSEEDDYEMVEAAAANEKSVGHGDDLKKPLRGNSKPAVMSRSGSVRRLQKYTSRRAKTAVRSFRIRLGTIYEGTTL